VNVAVFGYSKNAEIVLSFLIEKRVKISFVCFPRTDSIHKTHGIEKICGKYNILNFEYNPDSIVERLTSLKANLIFVASFPHILKKEVIDQPKYGVINLHGSLLPKYRGANPLNWALVNGESETGVTLYYIDEGIDTGDIIAQKKVLITPEDDGATLRNKIYQAGRALLEETWELFIQGKTVVTKQDDSKATYYRKRIPGDGRVDWRLQASEIDRLVRALVPPWPGAYFFYKGKKVIVSKAYIEIDNKPHFKPGRVLNVDKKGIAKVTTGYNVLAIEETIPRLDFSKGDRFE